MVVDLFAVFSLVANAAAVFVALVVTVAWSVLAAEFTDVMLVSTYDFTAFWVGNKTSLVPKVIVVDLFAVFSFVDKPETKSVLLALSANPGTVGAEAVPLKSPANCILPFTIEVASGAPEVMLEST